ncbi:MAG: aspartate/glutamate racemase family protein [Anaerolineae bacterium]
MNPPVANPLQLFGDYLKVTGVAHIDPEPEGDPALIGKRLGLLNGSSWVTLWANYFGRLFLPGVHLVNVGNEAVQMNFMQAHRDGLPTPPQSNIDAFTRYAKDLVELAQVDAVLITCSTMNRAYPQVQAALTPYGVPVAQIDRPMMERAVAHGGRVLVVATHGPTVGSTQALLQETAGAMGRAVTFSGLTVEAAWRRLAVGDVAGHNDTLAQAIRSHLAQEAIGCVVLAQLSMSVFLLSYPEPASAFGVPVFTSGQCGMEHMRELLTRA